MKKCWRWFGRFDKVTLDMLRQIGVEGVVTALHDVKNGEIWSPEAIEKRKSYIEKHGLVWSVVESLPVSEAVKYGGNDRDRLIENYIQSLINLSHAGVNTVCYNFMPVIDWIRTDLKYKLDDGTTTLYFDRVKFAYFDCKILCRKDAEADYSEAELQAVEDMNRKMTAAGRDALIDAVILKTQGFVNGNITENEYRPIELFNDLLSLYAGVDGDKLRSNLKYFLDAVMPVCDEYGVNLSIHPDDPPYSVLGLPRIVGCDEDIEWIMKAVDNPHNGLTLCTGSLSAGIHNDVVALAEKYASRTRFVHLRSTEVESSGNFIESSHLEGRGHLLDVIRIFMKQNPDVPMRVDHGREMLDDARVGYNPGYSFHGRMLAFGKVCGLISAAEDEFKRKMI